MPLWLDSATACCDSPRDAYALAVAAFARGDYRWALAWSEAVLEWCRDGVRERKFGDRKVVKMAGVRDQSRLQLKGK